MDAMGCLTFFSGLTRMFFFVFDILQSSGGYVQICSGFWCPPTYGGREVGKPEGKRPLGRPRRRWEDNIKMDLQEVGRGCEDWMELAQHRDISAARLCGSLW